MLLVLLAAGAAQLVEPAPIRADPAPLCGRTLSRIRVLSPSEARKLGQLPPGQLQLAVDKRVGGCSVTVLPIRDRNGDHVMTPGPNPELRAAGGSAAKRRPERQR